MGYAVSQIPYLCLAEKLGIGIADPKKAMVKELSAPKESMGKQSGYSRKVKSLVPYIKEDQACSACYAALVSALSRMSGELSHLKEPVCIGQGFTGKKGSVGIGRCTSGFARSCPGCPVSGAEALKFLRGVI
jgi:hypothetical protein